MQVITHHVTDFPGGDRSFLRLPFDVGPDIERIEVSYVSPPGSVIDIGLMRDGCDVGWTGSEYAHIWVAEDRASAGYRPGPLRGNWEVLLGVFKLGESAALDVEIRLIAKTPVWLAGELHSHTEHSDGGVTVGMALERARNSGCDFVALTDHNSTRQNFVTPDDAGLLKIPGMELTSNWGHTNFLGVAEPVSRWLCETVEEVPHRMSEARERGATIVINHPHAPGNNFWQSGLDVPFDAYEIWNGNWRIYDQQALDFWQAQLVAGRRIPITGGSDFHLKNKRRHGRPANRLLAPTRSVAGVLEAVRRGANVVARAPDETMVVPLPGTPVFGTDAEGPVGFRLTGLALGDHIHVVTPRGVAQTIVAQGSSQDIETHMTEHFLRIEAWRNGLPLLLSNPLYQGG